MAAGWSVMDALNKKSKATAEEKPKARFRTRDISIDRMYSNDRNFYSMADIEQLADTIQTVGLIENIAVVYDPCEKGEYRIVAGERRWRALKKLLERGYEEFKIATCQILTPAEEHEEMVQLIIANAYRTKNTKDILEEAKQLKESLQYMKDNNLTLCGVKLDGKIRDAIANIMKMSSTKIAQIDSINNNLLPEFKEKLGNGEMTFSAAYELSGMTQEEQAEMLENHENGSSPTLKEVRSAKKKEETDDEQGKVSESDTLPGQMKYPDEYESEEDQTQEEPDQEEEWQQAHPESITSLCYSCKRYSECNVKTGTCNHCDRYINKAEVEKTEEQRYEEQQDAIDRETRRKLQEKADEKKMDRLPSDSETQIECIRLSQAVFEDVMEGKKPYLIIKNDKVRVGMVIDVLEFVHGKATGRELHLEVICMDNGVTSSAVEDGYSIIGIRQQDN